MAGIAVEKQGLAGSEAWQLRGVALRKFGARYATGYLFLLPAVVLYATFKLYPFVNSIYLSFTDWDGAQPVKAFIGLANFARMFRDPLVWLSLSHNVAWILIGATAPVAISLILAVMVSRGTRGFMVFRTIYFMPQVLAMVVMGIIWSWVYDPMFGVLNRLLRVVGLGALARGWLGVPHLAYFAVQAAAIWRAIGFSFVIFVAALQNVDRDLLDAAEVDGANALQSFLNVTIPQISHVLTMVMAVRLVYGFNVFDIVYSMTNGGPANATEVIATYVFRKAFRENDVAYGAALSLMMTVLSLVASLLLIRARERQSE